MADRIRILRAITWLPRGGIERKILTVLPRLDRARFDVRVLCLRERGALADELEAAGIPVDVIPFRSRLDPAALGRYSHYLREKKIDLVHAHMYRAAIPSAIAGRMARVPVISQIHNVGTWESRRQAWMDRALIRWRKAILAVSERVKEDAVRTLKARPEFVRVIYNGVDLAHYQPPADAGAAKSALGFHPEAQVVLMAARLVEQKNPFGFLEVARRLAPRFPRAVFALAGGGRLEAPLREKADAFGMNQCFRMLGHVEGMAPAFQAADLFVLPSHKEGFSNAIIEAMSCGLPVVATDVGGNAEAVSLKGEAGRIVPPGDVDALEQAVAFYLGDEEARRKASAAARLRAQRFELGIMVRELETLYEEFAGRGQGTGI